jgi:hypothetical protein
VIFCESRKLDPGSLLKADLVLSDLRVFSAGCDLNWASRKMHLQQTKRESRTTGGPQYYFHNLTGPVKTFLRNKGAVRVALVTPYGATKTDYFAVSKDHKFSSSGKVVEGKVGHDRIQQGSAAQSIGEAIRYWHSLPRGDFETIDVEIEIIDDDFYLVPIRCNKFTQ